MTIEPNDFQSQLSVLLGLQGAVLTEEELYHTAEQYPRCRGQGHWGVREYVRRTGVGAREYRVVRGSSIEDVYRSADRVRAAAVVTALNEFESRERSGEAQEEARKSSATAARRQIQHGSAFPQRRPETPWLTS